MADAGAGLRGSGYGRAPRRQGASPACAAPTASLTASLRHGFGRRSGRHGSLPQEAPRSPQELTSEPGEFGHDFMPRTCHGRPGRLQWAEVSEPVRKALTCGYSERILRSGFLLSSRPGVRVPPGARGNSLAKISSGWLATTPDTASMPSCSERRSVITRVRPDSCGGKESDLTEPPGW